MITSDSALESNIFLKTKLGMDEGQKSLKHHPRGPIRDIVF